MLVLAASSCRERREESGLRMIAGAKRLVLRSTPTTRAHNLEFRDRCLAGEPFGGSEGPAGRLLSMRRLRQSTSPGKSSCELFLPSRRVRASEDVVSTERTPSHPEEVDHLDSTKVEDEHG